MLTATCHCGAVQISIARRPRSLTACNCSICRRYGTLWAYYQPRDVQVQAQPDATQGYVWGRGVLRFVRCAHCGCVTHWERVVPVEGRKMAVNGRLFSPEALGPVQIRHLDGASG